MTTSLAARLDEMDRRAFLLGSLAAAAVIAAPRIGRAATPHELPALPYAETALEPVISSRTIGFHYGKHHKGYVDNLNKLLADAPDLAELPMPELIKTTTANPNRTAIFNNAAQVWNHTFYWHSMRPGGGGQPTGKLKEKIDSDLGGYDKFREEFKKAAMTQFGSGWAWLIVKDGKLAITKTANAGTPVEQGLAALITIDVWEHAYYLDYQNRRADYVDAWLDKLVNWEFAAKNLG
ncbi:superoxide dismutase, Fe [Candidatus Defluviicoccus seviourii]|uniref:Superoxide dismutase n=2 Tax=root TaxID=1 RepID=A0A564WGE7_9PROT|nr:superoxide dismutase, Fe [uncultured Defluviicoccus sp.]VUX47567.1 superoxide dismutase, Fe [Candidatus Defluviicoccus seviourii]